MARNLKLASEQRRMKLKAQQLNLRVRLEQTKATLKATTAQIRALQPPRRRST